MQGRPPHPPTPLLFRAVHTPEDWACARDWQRQVLTSSLEDQPRTPFTSSTHGPCITKTQPQPPGRAVQQLELPTALAPVQPASLLRRGLVQHLSPPRCRCPPLVGSLCQLCLASTDGARRAHLDHRLDRHGDALRRCRQSLVRKFK